MPRGMPYWRDALLSFRHLGPISQVKAGQLMIVVIIYAHTDMGEDAAKDAFYFMLFAYLKEAPTSDKVVVLRDFNADLGNAW